MIVLRKTILVARSSTQRIVMIVDSLSAISVARYATQSSLMLVIRTTPFRYLKIVAAKSVITRKFSLLASCA